jgi:hypothetical protein
MLPQLAIGVLVGFVAAGNPISEGQTCALSH